MTQLVLDPPHPALHLVASNPQSGSDRRVTRHRREAVLGAISRRLYRDTLAWSLQHGGQVNPDALRVVLAARQDRQAAPATRFTTDDIWRLMMVDVVAWCRARRLDVPPGCAHALLLLIATIRDDDGFHPDSDDLADLEYAIDECTGGWSDPHHPTTARPPG
jgi:hypothetical protein